MWNLDDAQIYRKVVSLPLPFVHFWGKDGHVKREAIRTFANAYPDFPRPVPVAAWWAFRIFIRKKTVRGFDVENALKIIIDSFSTRQIQRDVSQFSAVGLYVDDNIDHVRLIQVAGERTDGCDTAYVEIFCNAAAKLD